MGPSCPIMDSLWQGRPPLVTSHPWEAQESRTHGSVVGRKTAACLWACCRTGGSLAVLSPCRRLLIRIALRPKHHKGSERKRKHEERQGNVLPRSGFYPKVATPQPHLVVKIIVDHSFFTTRPSPLTSEAETAHQQPAHAPGRDAGSRRSRGSSPRHPSPFRRRRPGLRSHRSRHRQPAPRAS